MRSIFWLFFVLQGAVIEVGTQGDIGVEDCKALDMIDAFFYNSLLLCHRGSLQYMARRSETELTMEHR